MITQKSSKNVYTNKWINVREDLVEFGGGEVGIYSVVEKQNFALIIPYENSNFYLVHQYRYPVSGQFWEFPQGDIIPEERHNVEIAALRELKEETGLLAHTIHHLGKLFVGYGFCDQSFDIFLATNLKQGRQQLDASEKGMKVEIFSVQKFEQMIEKSEIMDGPTVSAYSLLKIKGII
jgi:ADP-ribose pyrophosphatase